MDEGKMRICPVCGSNCFGDMETCFGCLHSFASDDGLRDDAGVQDGAVPEDDGFVPEEASGTAAAPLAALVPMITDVRAAACAGRAEREGAAGLAAAAPVCVPGGPAEFRIVIDFCGLGAAVQAHTVRPVSA